MAKDRTCNKCNRVYFSVSRKYAEKQVAEFNVFYEGLSKQKQQEYYGGKSSSITDYETCWRCGNSYKNFRAAKKDDCPNGSTMNPIIYSRMT